jgi:tetratricopeptide (TPR) repeat protein
MKSITNNYVPIKKHIARRTLILLGSLCFLLLACEKYVDIKRSSSAKLIETLEDCQLLLDNYGIMNSNYPSDGEVSTDAYYLDDAGFTSSRLSDADRDLYRWLPTAIRASATPQWQNSYFSIYYANLVLETTEKLRDKVDRTESDNVRGQALFFRASRFWHLAQLYCLTYDKNSATLNPGIPLRLSSDINGKSERGTIEQTYARIIQDLKEASQLLAITSPSPSRPCKTAALSMLARVYLSMKDYPQSLENATLALALKNNLLDYNKISASSSTPFIRFNDEVIFQSITVAAPILSAGSASSNICKINQALIASYNNNDLRKTIFFKPNSGSNAGSYRFSGNYEPVTSGSLFNGLAVDELYLTRAECYAREGNVASAMNDINSLLRTRWKEGTFVDLVVNNAEEALTLILNERKKELLMRTLEWTDLRRLNGDNRFVRNLSRSVNGVTYTLPANDNRFALLIPNEVILYSNISQNSR